MFYVILKFFLILIYACDVNSKRENRMISKNLAKSNEFPFAIAITDRNWNVFCTGSIITLMKVITASHCLVEGLAANCIAGTVDAKNLTKPAQKRKIRKYAWHPKAISIYHIVYDRYDVGIITVAKPFEETEFVKPIPFASKELQQVGGACKAVGFGISKVHGREIDGKLRWGNFKTVEDVLCGIKPMLYCIKSKSESAYFGDSGGPLINRNPPYRLYGTCQGGNDPPTFAQYVNSHAAMNWIRSELDQQPKWRSLFSMESGQSRRLTNFCDGIYLTVFVFILKIYNMVVMPIN